MKPHIFITKQDCFSEPTSVVNRPDGYIYRNRKLQRKGVIRRLCFNSNSKLSFAVDGSLKQVS